MADAISKNIGNVTLTFNTDVAMAATLREATAVDRQATADIHQNVVVLKESIDASSVAIGQWHSDVDSWQQAVSSDRDTVAQDKATVATDRQAVASDRNAVVQDKLLVAADKQAVAADRLTVAADLSAVSAHRTHVDNQVPLIDAKISNGLVTLNAKSGTEQQEIADVGADWKSQVQQTGDTASSTLENEKDQAVSDVRTEGGNQAAAVRNQGNQQVARVLQTGDQQVTRVEYEGEPIIAAATAQADRSSAQAVEATSQANQSKVARNEAVAAKDEAEAIVHEGEGSVTPGAGKYPVADANGYLDSGWTPLLAAMYPYSGVIGSIYKEDLFYFFHGTISWANLFDIRSPALVANIYGKFVKVKSGNGIKLPEAESTAERAVAFDDVFIDWDGNVQTYRSITPHRTTTGYDADAIATEHGWTKIQTGLYQSGETYALLLGRVVRRNKCLFHPQFNREGTAKAADGKTWDQTSISIASRADCFDPAKYDQNTGGIGQPNGRPGTDNKAYDGIYADDFTPLYYSAKNIIDRQALLFDSFNRVVAGETFMGAEGTPVFKKITTEVVSGGSDEWLGFYPNPTDRVGVTDYSAFSGGAGVMLMVVGDRTFFWQYTNTWAGTYFSETPNGSIKNGWNDVLAIGDFVDLYYLLPNYFANEAENSFSDIPARPQFQMVDIIGSLDAMPAEWLENGIPGNWLAVGEEGEDLIPDGTEKNFKLLRKCLECYQVLETTDNGVTWTDVTSTYSDTILGAGNTLGSLSVAATTCYMVFYRTAANPFELAEATKHISLYDMAYAVNDQNASLIHNLINKITINTGVNNRNFLPLVSVGLNTSANSLNSSNLTSPTAHPAVSLAANNPAGKALAVLSNVDNTLSLQCVYKELKHNGTTWGDDNKFDIVNNQSIITDLNGEEVIVGQKRCQLPYLFDGVTY